MFKAKKRGQFLIIGAVILGILILSLAATQNAVIKKDSISLKKFNGLCENYKNEIFEISRYTINAKSNEFYLINDFTINFSRYAGGVDKNFAFMYVYGNSDYAVVFNNFNKSAGIYATNDGGENYLGVLNGNCLTNFNSCTMAINNNINKIRILNETEKINKTYDIKDDEKFYFFAETIKDGEKYVCE